MSINIDLQKRIKDDDHRKRNQSAQKMRTAEEEKPVTRSKQFKQVMMSSAEQIQVMHPFSLNNTGSEMRQGFIGKDIGRVQGEFDNYDRQFTNEPSDLFREQEYRPRKVSYERQLDDNHQNALFLSVKKGKNLGQLRKPNTVTIVKNQDVTLRNMRSQGRPTATGLSGQPYQGNEDLDGIKSGRRKSFSPTYHKTPLKTSAKRGASPATKQKQSGQAKYTTQHMRGSASKQPQNSLSKNAQIQSKFDKQDREFPISGGESHTKTSKALVQKMKELGGQRKRIIQQTSVGRSKSRPKAGASPQALQKKNLQQEYNQRRVKMDSRLGQELDRNVVVPQAVVVPKKQIRDIYAEPKEDSEAEAYELDLIPGREGSPPPLRPGQHRVDYVRSKRAVAERIEHRFTADIGELDYNKTKLIQELNARLGELDALNEEKRALSVQLINQIKFVRDLQVSLGTADNGHITDIIDKEMEQSFREAKEEGIRLRELLKANQIEMDEIMYQMKLLRGEKDVTIVMRNGRVVNLEKATMGVDELMRYRQTILRDTDRMLLDVNNAQAEDAEVSRQVSQLQHEFDDISRDRSQIADEVRALQSQYDQTYHSNESRLRDMAYQFRVSKSHHSAVCLGKALEFIFKRRLLAYFQESRFHIKSDENQIASVLAFRKICYSYNDKRLKKYLQIWFQKALKPAQMIYQNKQVTNFITKDNFLKKVLIKWHLQKLISQTKRSQSTQNLKNCAKTFENLYLREYRYSFDLWRAHTNSRNTGQRRIIDFVRERTSYQKRQALFRWKQIVVQQNFQMKCNALAVRHTILQYKSGLFYAWREQTSNFRRNRISLMLRTWKILNKNRQNSKQVKQQTMRILKTQTESNKFQLINVFHALKLNKELEKQSKVHTRLKDEEDVAILVTNKKIQAVQARSAHKATKKAVQQGIMSPFKKVLKSYFDHWRLINSNYKFTLNSKIKVQIIKVYKQRLTEAFEKLKAKGTTKKKRMKMKMQVEMESENNIIQKQIAATVEKVKSEEVRSVKKGFAKFKKLLLKVYLDELRYRLMQWKNTLDVNNKKGAKLQKGILSKWQKQLYRQAFDKFKNKHESIKKEIKQEARTDALVERFQKRLLKGMYNTLQACASIKIRARKQFHKVLTTELNNYCKYYFENWKNFKEKDKAVKLKKRQMLATEEMQNTVDVKGENEDIIFKQEQKMSEMVRSNKSMSHKTMKKFIASWKNYTLYTAFSIWKTRSNSFSETKSKLQGTIFKRMYHQLSRDAFQTWRRNMVIIHQRKNTFSTAVEQENYKIQQEKIDASRLQIEQVREKTAFKVEKLKTKQEYKKVLIKNQIDKMIKDRNENFVVNKKAHIFDVWRQIGSHHAKTMKNFQTLLVKNHLQHGFDMICMTRNLDDRKAHKDKVLTKFIRKWEDNNVRGAWLLWKQNSYKIVAARIKTLQTAENHTDKNSEIMRNKYIEDRIPKYIKKSNQRTAYKCFVALFDYRAAQIGKKIAYNELQDKLGFLRMRFQFQKWVLRSDQTIIFRQKQKVLQNLWHRGRKQSIFKVLKNNRSQNKNLYNALSRIRENTREEQLRFSWQQIKQQSELVRIRNDRVKQDNQKLLVTVTNRLRFKNMKQRFDQLLINGRKMYYKRIQIKQILHKQIDRYYRDIFNKWKKNSDLLEVVRFNNEEGPVTMEVFEINKEIQALREFIKDKMIYHGTGKATPDLIDKSLDNMLNINEDSYENKINKSLIRLKFFGEGNRNENDKWLLPWCFDRWREFKKRRQAYAGALRFLSTNCADDGGLKRAFLKWKKKVAQQMEFLQGLTQEELFNRANRNGLTLMDISADLEAAHGEIEDLKNQREYLIEKVVLGQRLALARCRFSFMFAKEKVWVKFAANCLGGMRAEFDAALTAQVGEIGNLKGRMVDLEEENQDIAEQNEGLREGALEGVEALPQLEVVQQEVETINSNLMEQAEQIKQLLMKNKQLKQQLYDLGQ